jgi:hypothetical protein
LAAREAMLVREHNERAWLAYHIATLSRARKIVPLRDLQVRPRTARQRTWQEQLDALQSWVVATGGKIVHRKMDS